MRGGVRRGGRPSCGGAHPRGDSARWQQCQGPDDAWWKDFGSLLVGLDYIAYNFIKFILKSEELKFKSVTNGVISSAFILKRIFKATVKRNQKHYYTFRIHQNQE